MIYKKLGPNETLYIDGGLIRIKYIPASGKGARLGLILPEHMQVEREKLHLERNVFTSVNDSRLIDALREIN